MSHGASSRASSLIALSGGERAARAPGKVWLVGAGPGDPELLTRKAERLIAEADVVVHDRLVGEGVLALVPAATRRLYVGKRKSHHSVPQDELNSLLVALAREGLKVVRLKGGDPFVFGRGGEEMLACREAGVDCEIVPGISAALAAAASAGAPLTHRGLAQTLSLVTAHAAMADGEATEPDLDWTALGLSTAPVMAARLIAAGRAPSTPVLIVENASRSAERRALCTLATLTETARSFTGPAVLIVGETAALAHSTCEPSEATARAVA
jgi:uroporphyrin-III C-methyltransferase